MNDSGALSNRTEATRVLALPEGGEVRVSGILDVERTQEGGRAGLRLLRLPKRYFNEFPRFEGETMRTVVSGCAGARISFVTAADEVDLTVRCTRVDYGELPSASNDFVALVDGEERCCIEAPADVIERISRDGRSCDRTVNAASTTLRFGGLGRGGKTVTIWLPSTFFVDLIGIANAGVAARGESGVVAAPIPGRARWLHYGSSISHCHMLPKATMAWPSRVAQRSGLELTNLGYAGQCMLDSYVARAMSHTACDVMTISVGVNITGERALNQRTFIPAIHGFLDIIREIQPEVPIVLFSSILWPGSDDIPGPSDAKVLDDGRVQCYCYGDKKDIAYGALTLRQSRDDLKYAVQRRSGADHNLYYFDGLQLFGPKDVKVWHLVDGIHPDAELFAEMARRFSRIVFGEKGLVPVNKLSVRRP